MIVSLHVAAFAILNLLQLHGFANGFLMQPNDVAVGRPPASKATHQNTAATPSATTTSPLIVLKATSDEMMS